MKLLVGQGRIGPSLMVVGDPHQAIFDFMGGCPEILESTMLQDFGPDMAHFSLSLNHRYVFTYLVMNAPCQLFTKPTHP